MRWAVFLYYVLLPWCICLAVGLKAMEPVDHGPNPLKQWTKINLSSFKLIFLGIFFTVMKSWLMQEGSRWIRYGGSCKTWMDKRWVMSGEWNFGFTSRKILEAKKPH
jgi:hypothetical protein